MYINSLNHFRAISILIIVAGHSFYLAGIHFDSTAEYVVLNMIQGGTALFVFISGFLFRSVFYEKFRYNKFLLGKIKTVVAPYTFLSIIPILYSVYMGKPNWDGFFLPNGAGVFYEYIWPTTKYYGTGRFLIAYWYIPFIFVTFLMAPLHIAYIKTSNRAQILILIVLILISSLVHRPLDNINVFQHVLYYLPVYLFGIWCSTNKEAVYSALRGKDIYLLAAAVLLALLQYFLGDEGNYNKEAFALTKVDLMLYQKLLMCLFFMIWLHRYESYNNKLVNILATTSFTIFFMHPFILSLLEKMPFIPISPDSWLSYLFIVSGLVISCVMIAMIFKKIFPSYSRYMIGY